MTSYKNTGFSIVVEVAWLLPWLLCSLPCNNLINNVAPRSVPSTHSWCVGADSDDGTRVHDFFMLIDSVLAVSYAVPEPVPPAPTEESNGTDSAKAPKVTCEERNATGIERSTLQILNVSQDLMEFLNPNSSDCTLVLFYTPWCRFSASLAPHFNCLPRAFPTLRFLALDASQHSSLSTRFGTVAVPNILLFQGAKPMARFNHTDRTLETLKDFIFNQTGIEAKSDVAVTKEDWEGPLPSVLTKGIDWLLLFSVLFLASFVVYATVRTESIRWLIPGQEHEHQE
ncbi:thioredoxin domain containing 15 [Columba livia]|uniref:Thioredoxin domain containing 15 n=1 Tax=Columba livia TaxID=8932 RepID=A0A2I0MA26_COLLI|nr:thioredoxin domain containing 15 [Columba livia]